jgi:polyphosphate glucokinase
MDQIDLDASGAVAMLAVGVDVGGTAVKAGVVDLARGSIVGAVRRLATPRPPTVSAVVETVGDAVRELERTVEEAPLRLLPLGVGLSGDVRDGIHTTGVNLHPSWIGSPVRRLLEARLQRSITIINDADAAGIGEMRFGAGRGARGVVVLLTFGTGIGSAVFNAGRLVPNTAFGQFPFHGIDVERRLSAVARERRRIPWSQWTRELNEFLPTIEALLHPALIVIGGGASEAWDEYADLISAPTSVVRAELGNAAGVIGAASFAGDALPGFAASTGIDG